MKRSADELRPVTELSSVEQKLVAQAVQVRARAYAPYSKYLVGSALQDERGNTHVGCNVENCAYPSMICAERSAIARMIADGGKHIGKIVIATSSDLPAFPCGSCLQVIAEFGKDAEVIATDTAGKVFRRAKFQDLFPYSFTPEMLK